MNQEELEACIQAYGRDIYSFCLQLTKSRQEADDLYQDTFLKIVEIRERLDFKSNPKGYLLSVCVNLWRNRRRKFAWRQRIAGPELRMDDTDTAWEPPSGEASVEEQMISREERGLVQKAVDDLPEKYRMPVLLFYMEELKISEISGILKIPAGTVKSRLYKAKKALEKKLEVVLNEK
ncbi:MAG: RNA polymerase sigma factor [Lachnospiraceae bacterium]